MTKPVKKAPLEQRIKRFAGKLVKRITKEYEANPGLGSDLDWKRLYKLSKAAGWRLRVNPIVLGSMVEGNILAYCEEKPLPANEERWSFFIECFGSYHHPRMYHEESLYTELCFRKSDYVEQYKKHFLAGDRALSVRKMP